MSLFVANRLQRIEVRQAGLASGAVASHLAAKEQELADAALAQSLLDDDRAVASASPEDDATLAQQLADEEERQSDKRDDIEDLDKKLASRLKAEEEEHVSSITCDRFLATSLQAEHGRAGKLLARAECLEDFLEAPLGSRPLPKNNDLMPETLRRLAVMSSLASGRKLPASSPFRATGTAIAGGVR